MKTLYGGYAEDKLSADNPRATLHPHLTDDEDDDALPLFKAHPPTDTE